MESSLMNYFIINNELRSTCDFNPYFFKNYKSVYEVVRVEKGVPLFIEDHIERFYNSGKLAGININISENRILVKIKALIESNRLITGLIKFIYQDAGDKNGMFSAWITPFYFPSKEQYNKGVELSVMHAERDNPSAKYANLSVRQKADEMIKKKNVFEVVLINNKNVITEGSRSNIFLLKKDLDLLFTPHENLVLKGVTRKKIFELAVKHGIDIFESEYYLNELPVFDTVFLTGTSPKVLPVRKIDDFEFDTENYILRFLQQEYDNLIAFYINNFRW